MMNVKMILSNMFLRVYKNFFLFLLTFVFCCCNPDNPGPDQPDSENPSWGNQPPLPIISGESKFTLTDDEDYVNVMESHMPQMPNFPQVAVKEGKLRGFVADLRGKPLEGALIGVRSTAVGGFYSSASDETDENGYYEIQIPWGATKIYASGYTIDYGSGRAALGLYPADGKNQSFESTKGLVKNFVLLSYGLGDANSRAERPWYAPGYFGGSVYISYNLGDPGDIWAAAGSLPFNSEIEIKLTPKDETLYEESRTFVINKRVGNLNFTINNIPVGKYTLSAKLKDGRALKLKQIGSYVSVYPHHGLKPKEALGSVEVYFTSLGVDPNSALPNFGNWRPVDVKVELP